MNRSFILAWDNICGVQCLAKTTTISNEEDVEGNHNDADADDDDDGVRLCFSVMNSLFLARLALLENPKHHHHHHHHQNHHISTQLSRHDDYYCIALVSSSPSTDSDESHHHSLFGICIVCQVSLLSMNHAIPIIIDGLEDLVSRVRGFHSPLKLCRDSMHIVGQGLRQRSFPNFQLIFSQSYFVRTCRLTDSFLARSIASHLRHRANRTVIIAAPGIIVATMLNTIGLFCRTPDDEDYVNLDPGNSVFNPCKKLQAVPSLDLVWREWSGKYPLTVIDMEALRVYEREVVAAAAADEKGGMGVLMASRTRCKEIDLLLEDMRVIPLDTMRLAHLQRTIRHNSPHQ